MRYRKYGMLVGVVGICLVAAGLSLPSVAETPFYNFDDFESDIKHDSKDLFSNDYPFYEEFVKRHFEVEIRFTDYKFDRSHESSRADKYFIGSNAKIEAEDRDAGMRNLKLGWFPFADSEEWIKGAKDSNWRYFFYLLQGVGLELTWDELRAKAITPIRDGAPAYTDGTIVAKGPMLSFVINVENPTPVTPYFGIGWADYNDLEVTEGWWHWGFGSIESYDQWRADGSPGNPNGGYRRTFKVSEEVRNFWYLGLAVEVYENWHVDIFYRMTDAKFDNKYTLSVGDHVLQTRHSKWDLSNKTYGIGMKYTF